MKTKFTKGKWELLSKINGRECYVNNCRVVVKDEFKKVSNLIVDTRNCSVDLSGEELEANAKLIAAAPELLNTLKWVRRKYEYTLCKEADDMMDEAIKKATL